MTPKAKRKYKKIKEKQQLLLKNTQFTRKECRKYSVDDQYVIESLAGKRVIFVVTKEDKVGVWGKLTKGIVDLGASRG